MNYNPVFVLVMAKTCGACQNFKRRIWPNLKQELERLNKVDIVEIELSSTNSVVSNTTYHPELKKFIGWFPTILLFTGDSWNNKSSKLEGIVKNGKLNNNGVEFVGKPDFSKQSVLEWLNENLNQNALFKNSNSIIITENGRTIDKGFIPLKDTDNNYRVPTYGQIKFTESKLPKDW